MSTTIAIADAKANLSSVIKRVGDFGEAYTVTVRGVPVAKIVPVVPTSPKKHGGFGALAGKRPAVAPELEKESWAEAMEEKHGKAAGC